MSYFKRPMSGLGGVENCGNDQVWDPNVVVAAGTAYQTTGQCMPRANYTAADLVNVSAYPGTVKTKGAAASSGGGFFSDFFKALTAPVPATPAAQVAVSRPSSGISTTTVVLAGGAALLLVVLLAKRD